MSATVTLHCDAVKCMATFTDGFHASETFIRNAAASPQGWTTRHRAGTSRIYTYDFCKEHSK